MFMEKCHDSTSEFEYSSRRVSKGRKECLTPLASKVMMIYSSVKFLINVWHIPKLSDITFLGRLNQSIVIATNSLKHQKDKSYSC